VATWAVTIAEYDILGRVKRSSVPTEVTYGNVNDPDTKSAAGDDLTRGFLWTYQKYDWMGRVVRKINTDGADSPTANDSDVFITYEGCGCAGGLVTTVEGELVPRTDTSGNARRKQKIYQDILGRTTKMFHAAGKIRSFSHEQMNSAAQNLGSSSFTAYVEKHCVPAAYRSGLQ